MPLSSMAALIFRDSAPVGQYSFAGNAGNSVVFREDVSFNGATIGGDAKFESVQFVKTADFDGSRIQGNLEFGLLDGVAVRFGGEVRFRDAEVGGSGRFQQAEFCEGALFNRATIKGALFFGANANRTPVIFRKDVRFNRARIRGEADFQSADFGGEADFSGALIEGAAWFQSFGNTSRTEFRGTVRFMDARLLEGARFRGARFWVDAHFEPIQIGGPAFFNKDDAPEAPEVEFHGPARFDQARIGGEANFRFAKFGGTERRETRFHHATFSEAAYFQGIECTGPIGFFRASFGDSVYFGSPQAASRFSEDFSFNSASVVGQASFDGAIFSGYADFFAAEIRGAAYFIPASATCVRFDGGVRFTNVSITGEASFRGVQFSKRQKTDAPGSADADFSHSSFGSRMDFGSHILRPTEFLGTARLSDITVHGRAGFAGARFCGDATFSRAHFRAPVLFEPDGTKQSVEFQSRADFRGARFDSEARFVGIRFGKFEANFFGSQFSGDAAFDETIFGGRVTFNGSEVKQRASFINTKFKDKVFFAETHFNTVLMHGMDQKHSGATQFGGTVDLRGFTYSRIYVDWSDLLDRQEIYDRQPYTQLETSLKLAGKDQEADAVYRKRRETENEEDRKRGRGLFTTVDWLFGFLAGYGISPVRCGLVLLALWVIGVAVFSAPRTPEPNSSGKCMTLAFVDARLVLEGCKQSGAPTVSDAMAISANQLVPIPLVLGSDWKPIGLGALYASFHRLIGGVFLSLGVAAVIGLLHRKAK